MEGSSRRRLPETQAKVQKRTEAQRDFRAGQADRRKGGEEEPVIEFPEYDLRRAATARDPLAVAEGYKLQILLRLAIVLGVLRCPMCLQCNEGAFGCQDCFGNNMRPMGGVIGGMCGLGVGTEHQGSGTPHLHAEGHVVSAYQYGTLQDIADQIGSGSLSVAALKQVQAWLHREDALHNEMADEFLPRVEQEWRERFAAREHHGLFLTPAFLEEDAFAEKPRTISTARCRETLQYIQKDCERYKDAYLRHAQFVFRRVQHHVHRKNKRAFESLHAEVEEAVPNSQTRFPEDKALDGATAGRMSMPCQEVGTKSFRTQKRFRQHLGQEGPRVAERCASRVCSCLRVELSHHARLACTCVAGDP